MTAGVNTRLTAAERHAVVAKAAPRLVVDERESLGAVPPLAGAVAEIGIARMPDEIGGRLRVAGGSLPQVGEDPDRSVAIVFTSGTTGVAVARRDTAAPSPARRDATGGSVPA